MKPLERQAGPRRALSALAAAWVDSVRVLEQTCPTHRHARPASPPSSEFVSIDGEPFLVVRDVDRLPPFLMTVVSHVRSLALRVEPGRAHRGPGVTVGRAVPLRHRRQAAHRPLPQRAADDGCASKAPAGRRCGNPFATRTTTRRCAATSTRARWGTSSSSKRCTRASASASAPAGPPASASASCAR